MYFEVKFPLEVCAGSLGMIALPEGRYAYVGSARRGVEARIARHRRLADTKIGKLRWHIDYVLSHAAAQWLNATAIRNGVECAISKRMASTRNIAVPIQRFGSSDCRSGCLAHLYRLPPDYAIARRIRIRH